MNELLARVRAALRRGPIDGSEDAAIEVGDFRLDPAKHLVFVRGKEVTHVIFGQSARSRWEIIWKGSVINRFLREVKDAAVHVVPLDSDTTKKK